LEVDDQTAKSPQLIAIGFVQDARAYVEAARTLHDVHGDTPRFFSPTYFLLCQAMELGLKAQLSAAGVSKRKLRKRIGHDIELAYRYARRFFRFTPADARFSHLVRWLAAYHRDHSFRYRKTGFRRLPAALEAAEIISATVNGIEPYVRRQFLKLRGQSGR
jgi:hypothetical protein